MTPAGAGDGGNDREFRLDPLTRQWVTIVATRQDRPNLAGDPAGDGPDGAAPCPFCVGGLEAPDPYTVRAFANRWPAFAPGEPVDIEGALAHGSGFVSLPARGAAEVVLYSPDHTGSLATIGVDGARRVVDLWAERTAALLDRPEIEYVLVFENRGAMVGATIPHPHGQIYAFPFVPPAPQREAEVAAEHGCTVCAAMRDERADGTRVVRDERWLAHVRAVRLCVSVRRGPGARWTRRGTPRPRGRVTRRTRRRARRHRGALRPAVRPGAALPDVGAPRRACARALRATPALGGLPALPGVGRGRQRDARQPGGPRSGRDRPPRAPDLATTLPR